MQYHFLLLPFWRPSLRPVLRCVLYLRVAGTPDEEQKLTTYMISSGNTSCANRSTILIGTRMTRVIKIYLHKIKKPSDMRLLGTMLRQNHGSSYEAKDNRDFFACMTSAVKCLLALKCHLQFLTWLVIIPRLICLLVDLLLISPFTGHSGLMITFQF